MHEAHGHLPALSKAVDALRFSPPTAFVYNPLDYADAAVKQYMDRWASPGVEALLVGMNPGPWAWPRPAFRSVK